MSVLYVMLPMALLLAAMALYAFIRAASAGQFDDLDTPPLRAILSDDRPDQASASESIQAISQNATPPIEGRTR